jgi:hypothetical protein
MNATRLPVARLKIMVLIAGGACAEHAQRPVKVHLCDVSELVDFIAQKDQNCKDLRDIQRGRSKTIYPTHLPKQLIVGNHKVLRENTFGGLQAKLDSAILGLRGLCGWM